jgi:hypothetical protein
MLRLKVLAIEVGPNDVSEFWHQPANRRFLGGAPSFGTPHADTRLSAAAGL